MCTFFWKSLDIKEAKVRRRKPSYGDDNRTLQINASLWGDRNSNLVRAAKVILLFLPLFALANLGKADIIAIHIMESRVKFIFLLWLTETLENVWCRLLTGSILAHEMMHAWLRLKGDILFG